VLLGACVQGSRGHQNAREKVGENEGKFANSPRQRTEAKMAWFDGVVLGKSDGQFFLRAAALVRGRGGSRGPK